MLPRGSAGPAPENTSSRAPHTLQSRLDVATLAGRPPHPPVSPSGRRASAISLSEIPLPSFHSDDEQVTTLPQTTISGDAYKAPSWGSRTASSEDFGRPKDTRRPSHPVVTTLEVDLGADVDTGDSIPRRRSVRNIPAQATQRSVIHSSETGVDMDELDETGTGYQSGASDADSENSSGRFVGDLLVSGEGMLVPHGSTLRAKKKRTRTLPTAHQSTELNKLLAETPFPSTARREELGKRIGLSARKVQVWFQNRRQKARRTRGVGLGGHHASTTGQDTDDHYQAEDASDQPPAAFQPGPSMSFDSRRSSNWSLQDDESVGEVSKRYPLGPAQPWDQDWSSSWSNNAGTSGVASIRRQRSPAPPVGDMVRHTTSRVHTSSQFGWSDGRRTSSASNAPSPTVYPLAQPQMSSHASLHEPSQLHTVDDLRLPPLHLPLETPASPATSSPPAQPQSIPGPHQPLSNSSTNDYPPPFTLQPHPIWDSSMLSTPLSAASFRGGPIRRLTPSPDSRRSSHITSQDPCLSPYYSTRSASQHHVPPSQSKFGDRPDWRRTRR